MTSETDKLKIGEIRYANCTPIYMTLKERFDCSGYEFVRGEPSALNRLLAGGGIDASASSSIEYARHAGEYLVMPGVSISSTGDVGSILLFSKLEIERLGGARVAVTSASATSTVLLKALLGKVYGIEAAYEPRPPALAAMLSDCEAALIIGDEALKEHLALGPDPTVRVYDLGGLWREATGLPFVFALWMVRRDSAARKATLVDRLKSDLPAARSAAERDYEGIAARAAEAGWMGSGPLAAYWRAVSYGLDELHVKGLMRFFEMAHELGEAPRVDGIDFLR